MRHAVLAFVTLVALSMSATLLAAEPELQALELKPATDGPGLRYRMLVPKHGPDEKLPLLLCMHGAGERGDDNQKHLGYFVPLYTGENGEKYRCIVVLPQVPNGKLWASYGWSTSFNAMQKEPSETMQLTKQLVDQLLKTQPIDPDRVYVTGLSMGGYGTWEFTQRWPELVAAAAPVCGGGDPAQAERIKKIPLWAFHGAKDGVVKLEESAKAVDALKAAGAQPKLTVYEQVGHDSWRPAYNDPGIMKWFFEQRRTAK